MRLTLSFVDPTQDRPGSNRRRMIWVPVLLTAALVVGAGAVASSTSDAKPPARPVAPAAAGGLKDGLANPPLKDCPAKVLVSYDMSGSITDAQVPQIKAAVKGVVAAFRDKPVAVRTMGWATRAPAYLYQSIPDNEGPMAGYDQVTATSQPDFDRIVDAANFSLPSAESWTNHEAAIVAAANAGAPDLMILITDGVPTKTGGDTLPGWLGPRSTALVGSDPTPSWNTNAFRDVANPAIDAANGLKAIAGTRIVPVVVGGLGQFAAYQPYFEQLGSADSVQFVENYGALALYLNALAGALCVPEDPKLSVETVVSGGGGAEVVENTPVSWTVKVCNGGNVDLSNVSWSDSSGALGGSQKTDSALSHVAPGNCWETTVNKTVPSPWPETPQPDDGPGSRYCYPIAPPAFPNCPGGTITATGTSPKGTVVTSTGSWQAVTVITPGPKPT